MSYPVLHSLPGKYSSEEWRQEERRYLLAGHHAFGILQTFGDQDPLYTLETMSNAPALRSMASTCFPYVSPTTGESQRGISCKGCQIAYEAEMSGENYVRRERIYSRDRFLLHFRECREAERLWLSSAGRTVVVEEPAWTRRGGALYLLRE